MVTIDAHHHFWDTTSGAYDYPWMTDELAAMRGRRGPDELRPLLASRGVDRTIVVQAISSLPETRELLSIAAKTDFVAGVVGWVDLTDPDVAATLAELRRPGGGKLVGIRHQVHDEEDPDWIRRADVRRGLAAVLEAGLTYDVLVRSRELDAALEVMRSFPEARFVVDHIAKPPIRDHVMEPWATQMASVAELPNVWVKLSGMIEEADWSAWKPADLVPYVQRLLEHFGPRRLVFGSNWPFCLVAGSYQQVYDALIEALGAIGDEALGWILGDNATRAYPVAPAS